MDLHKHSSVFVKRPISSYSFNILILKMWRAFPTVGSYTKEKNWEKLQKIANMNKVEPPLISRSNPDNAADS